MDQHTLDRLEELIEVRAGIEAATLTPRVVERTLGTRMKARGLTAPEDYFELVRVDENELAELIDEVAVPETWFFRDHGPFELLRTWLHAEWLSRRRPGELRILSMPCSSGEEPYSIAMLLLEEGLGRDSFSIDAVDISRRALEKARRGVYGRQAFREKGWPIGGSYFRDTEDGRELDPAVRSTVRFVAANAVTYGEDAAPRPCYSVIFCRNLLIYLSAEARRRLTANLDAMLAPGGLAFLGHAEAPHVFLPSYLPVRSPRSFAARKPPAERAGLATARPPAAQPVEAPLRAVVPLARPGRPARQGAPARPAVRLVTAEPDTADETLARARERADGGDLDGAEALCRAAQTARPMAAEPYYLLGVIAHARGAASLAEDYLRKSLFLEPRHLGALVQLRLLLQGSGRCDEAATLTGRIRRLERSA